MAIATPAARRCPPGSRLEMARVGWVLPMGGNDGDLVRRRHRAQAHLRRGRTGESRRISVGSPGLGRRLPFACGTPLLRRRRSPAGESHPARKRFVGSRPRSPTPPSARWIGVKRDLPIAPDPRLRADVTTVVGREPALEDLNHTGERHMAQRLKTLDEQVVVITGTRRGIGLATARLAAARGAGSCWPHATGMLNQLADEIRARGGRGHRRRRGRRQGGGRPGDRPRRGRAVRRLRHLGE